MLCLARYNWDSTCLRKSLIQRTYIHIRRDKRLICGRDKNKSFSPRLFMSANRRKKSVEQVDWHFVQARNAYNHNGFRRVIFTHQDLVSCTRAVNRWSRCLIWYWCRMSVILPRQKFRTTISRSAAGCNTADDLTLAVYDSHVSACTKYCGELNTDLLHSPHKALFKSPRRNETVLPLDRKYDRFSPAEIRPLGPCRFRKLANSKPAHLVRLHELGLTFRP